MRHRHARSALRGLAAATGLLAIGTVTAIGQQPQQLPPQQTPPKQQAPATPQTALPSARQLVDKHIAAIGGQAALKAVTSFHARGKFEMAQQGMAGDLEVMAARPNKMLQRVEIQGVGHIESGFDGKNGWLIDPMSGPTLLSGRMLTEMAEDAWFDSALRAPDRVKEMTTVAKTEWDKHPAYQVKVVFNSGVEQTEYFDAETGLQIGSEAQRDTPMGVLPQSTTLREYQKFGALMQPTVQWQRTMGIDQVFRVTSYEYNDVPANAFDPPPAVKALIKKP